jgi:hypothetical protein
MILGEKTKLPTFMGGLPIIITELSRQRGSKRLGVFVMIAVPFETGKSKRLLLKRLPYLLVRHYKLCLSEEWDVRDSGIKHC